MATHRDPRPQPAAVAPSRLRGVLDLAVLAVVAVEPTHGYGVARRLAEAGVGGVKGGTLYPLLGRLEERGLVVADWEPGEGGPPRKRYALTPAGRRHLADEAASWERLVTGVHRLLADADSDASSTPPSAGTGAMR